MVGLVVVRVVDSSGLARSTEAVSAGATAVAVATSEPTTTRVPSSGRRAPTTPGAREPAVVGSQTSSTTIRWRTAVMSASTDEPPVADTTRASRCTPARRSPPRTAAGRASTASTSTAPPEPGERQSVPTCATSERSGGLRSLATPGTRSTAARAAQPTRDRPHHDRRLATTAPAAATAATASGTIPSSPSGAAAPCRATSSTHQSSTEVGRWSTPAIGEPTSPATRPPVRPQAMISAAAGSASRLAGTPTTGSPPDRPTSSGPTATCAARVTPNAAATGRGPGRCSPSGRASSRMPADAATESWKPKTPTSMGSTSTRTITARARVRMPDTGRPSIQAVAAIAAMAEARSTEGSKRVITPKSPTTTSVATQRHRSPSRRSSGRATTSTNATFSPETTSRCDSPAPSKSSATATDWPRSSPKTNPENSARRSAGRAAAPRSNVARTALATRYAGPPSPAGCRSPASMRPTMWRRAAQSSPPGRGAIWPRTRISWPAVRPDRTAPGRPRAHRSKWCPSARTSACIAPPRRSGSVSRVARPDHAPGGAGRVPSQACADSAEPRTVTATASSSGRRQASATTATPAGGQTGTGTATHAPSAVAAARPTTARSPSSPTRRAVTPAPGCGAGPAWRLRCHAPRRGRRPCGTARCAGGGR